MKNLITLMCLLVSLNSFARPACLERFDCIEHNGQIIDIRSRAQKEMEKLEFDPKDDSLPLLSKKEYSSLVGKKGTQYFIPLELRKSDMLMLTGALSLGVVVFSNDKEIMEFVQDSKVETMRPIASIGNLMGREAIVPIAAGAYFIGAVLKNNKLKKVGLFTVAGGIATQIVTEAFKKTFQRVRPNASDSPYDFFEDHNNSFFSGHTSGAFSLATVVAEVYKDKPLVPYIAYGLAALTAYARMHDKKHWASDVLAGAIAGHLVTKILIRSMEHSERTGSGFLVIPQFGIEENGGYSVGVKVHWSPRDKARTKCGDYGFTGRELIEACMTEVFSHSN